MDQATMVAWLRDRAKTYRTEADQLDATADRLVMLTDRLVVAPAPVEPSPVAPITDATKPMTADEVCKRLGCAGEYIAKLRNHGIIKRDKRPGRMGCTLFTRKSVEAVRFTWHERLAEALANATKPDLVSTHVAASLPPVDEPDHDGPQSAVAETVDPTPAEAPKPAKTRAPVQRKKATNEHDAPDPFPDGPTVPSLALVMRWGLTMRQLKAIVGEGWLRANADGEVLEHDAQWFEKGTGPGSLRQWKRDNVGGKGYGVPAVASLGSMEW